MSPRRDPDAHLGPRARASNREERTTAWRWMAVGYSVFAAAFVVLAIAPGRSTTNRILAVCWVGLADFYWCVYARARRQNSFGDEGSEGGA